MQRILKFKERDQGLMLISQGVEIAIYNHGRTALDFIPLVVEANKRFKKGSGYHKRILLNQKLKGRLTWRKGLSSLSNKTM